MRGILFKVGLALKNPNFLKIVKDIDADSHLNTKLEQMLSFAIQHVPYYKNMSNKIDEMPIITKQLIRDNYNAFIPDIKIPFVIGRTGGSTGEPFQYRMSKLDEMVGLALMYRGWGYAGYKMGDSMFLIGGRSIVPPRMAIINNIKGYILNERRYSSFDMSNEYINKIISDINKYRPKFIRGYAASLDLVARYAIQHNETIDYSPMGIFSTAEMLYPEARENIEKAFNADVYNQYGVNDGGISAYECDQHNMHADEYRALLEVHEGKILATNLINRAFAFIRYDTGDLGELCYGHCACGRDTPILSSIKGRSADFIELPDGSKVHTEFFYHIFWDIACKQFQVIQKSKNLTILVVPWDGPVNTNFIKKIVENRCKGMSVDVKMVSGIKTENKYKAVVKDGI